MHPSTCGLRPSGALGLGRAAATCARGSLQTVFASLPLGGVGASRRRGEGRRSRWLAGAPHASAGLPRAFALLRVCASVRARVCAVRIHTQARACAHCTVMNVTVQTCCERKCVRACVLCAFMSVMCTCEHTFMWVLQCKHASVCAQTRRHDECSVCVLARDRSCGAHGSGNGGGGCREHTQ